MLGCQHPWDSCPCTTLLLPDTPSQGSHKDTFSPVCTCHSSHCPGALQPGQAGTWDARCNAGSSPLSPLPCQGWGRHCRAGARSSPSITCSIPSSIAPIALPHWAGSPRTALGAVPEDPLPAPPSSPGSRQGCRFYLEPRTNTAEISEVTWHHQSAHGARLRIPGPASLPLSPSYAHGAHPASV